MHRFIYPLLFLFTISHGTSGRAQDTVAIQSFEPPPPGIPELSYAPDVPPHGRRGVPTWNVAHRIKGIDTASAGTYFWAARDVENPKTGGPVAHLSFDAGSICELTSARFVFDYRIVGYDGGDDFGYTLYIDGFAHERAILIDGRNGGGVSTDGWVSDTVSIPGTAQTARLELFFDQNGDDVAGVDNVRLLASGRGGGCNPVCGLKLGNPLLDCTEFTEAADTLRVRVPYRGAEEGVVLTINEATIGGNDPARIQDGTIELTGLVEGRAYLLTADGGDCRLELPLQPPADQCRPSSLVINEVLAAPGQDVNHDGSVTPADEFVEVYNAGDTTVALEDHTLHEGSNSGPRFTFPTGAALGPGEHFVVYAGTGNGGWVGDDGCQHGVASGFLGLNDNSPETVSLRDAGGRVVAQASFADAPDGESLLLSPDGNLAGGYRPHSQVYGSPGAAPCGPAPGRPTPITLLDLRATAVSTDAVRLDWSTALEIDNDYFEVERAKDGRRYISLGRVAARAERGGGASYAYVDDAALPGQNFYRLRQVDVDGTPTLYGPVSVVLDSGQLLAYPNPTSHRLHMGSTVEEGERVDVYRTDGRLVLTSYGPELDVSGLQMGAYYVQLWWRGRYRQLRFVKH